MSSESPVVYQEETVEEIIPDIKPLLEDHWEEVAINQDKIKLNPDFEAYKALGSSGKAKFYSARVDGELVGYFVVIVNKHIHYSDHIFAYNDVIYIKDELRDSGVGKRLIQFAEDMLKQDGVSVLVINTKVHQPFDGLMRHIGYTLAERVYSKYIGD